MLQCLLLACAKTSRSSRSSVRKGLFGDDFRGVTWQSGYQRRSSEAFFTDCVSQNLKIGQTGLADFELQVIRWLMDIVDEDGGEHTSGR